MSLIIVDYKIEQKGNSVSINLSIFSFKFDLDPAPRDVRVVRINDTAIQVFWTPIYHPPVVRYLIYYNDKSDGKAEAEWPLFSPSNPAANQAIISGLKSDAMYNVRVSAEFSLSNPNDPSYAPGMGQREGDRSEIHVADIYHRKFNNYHCFIR